MKLLAAVVFGFALGTISADHHVKAESPACEKAKANAERFAKAVAHVLNGGGVETPYTIVSCRALHVPREERL